LRQARLAADAAPTPHTYDLLAELLDRAGQHEAAQRQRDAGAPLDRELIAAGVQIDLELAVHQADFAVQPAATIAAARRARVDAPSIHADDAVGWALARAGRCDEALAHAERSLRLGTRDALKFFHRGYAEGCSGDREAMRASYRQALAIDPEFSVRWAPVAREALRGG
jgi:tetratricopeptide (TPR) repeat protein